MVLTFHKREYAVTHTDLRKKIIGKLLEGVQYPVSTKLSECIFFKTVRKNESSASVDIYQMRTTFLL